MKLAIGIGCAVVGTLALALVATEVALQIKKKKANQGKKAPYSVETKKLLDELWEKNFGKKTEEQTVEQGEPQAEVAAE